MWRCALLLLIFSFVWSALTAQSDYFQQEVNYTIHVTLLDEDHLLEGWIRIEYINHSPDVLDYIYMHHWPNAYSSPESPMARQLLKNGSYRFHFSGTENMGSISSLKYTIDDKDVAFADDDTPVDYDKINLPSSLLPGDTIIIETPFKVEIPGAEISRFGHDGQAYYVTQWYPKPAVYDANGWHPMSYLSQGEFYSEFGRYDVYVTTPANYVVMATGEIQDQGEIDWLKELDLYTRKKARFSSDMSFPPSTSETKTLHFSQDNIHDFAWFADKRYHVLYDRVVLPHSGDTVDTWAAFTNNEAEMWMFSTDYLKDAIHYYSLWNGDYPYSQVTAVDGVISEGAGMEYPTITLIGESSRDIDLETVIVHEVGHNWFYGILANNERTHPWLDEGLNSAVEMRYLENKYPKLNVLNSDTTNTLLKLVRGESLLHKDQNHLVYQWAARQHLDQAISLPSTDFTPINYGGMVYAKSALVVNYLRAYLGDQAFDKMMRQYYNQHQFQHVSPKDFLSEVDKALDQQSEWFFDLIFTTEKTDFKAARLKKRGNEYELKVKSIGDINGPVQYTLLSETDSILQQHWIPPFRGTNTVSLPPDFHTVVLDHARHSLDINRKNNQIKREGILRKMEKLRLQFFAGVEEPDRTTIYFSPLIGYNTTDQVMAGLLFHNQNVFQKRVELRLAPMYGFGSERFNWMGALRYNFRFQDSRWVENLWFEGNSTSFSTGGIPNRGSFTTAQIVGNIDFKRTPLNRNLSHHLFSSVTAVREEFPGSPDIMGNTVTDNLYGSIVYTARNRFPMRPYEISVGTDIHEDFDRFWLEFNSEFIMNANERAVKVRLFWGSFSHNNTNQARYNFRMDGINGPQDFRYNHIFLGRYEQEGFLSQQFVEGHGNFKIPTANGQSNDWLIALNLKVEAPFKVPIGVFADFGFNAAALDGFSDLLYTSGIYVWLVPDAVEVYFPIPVSVFTAEDIQNEIEARGSNYSELIRFMINFNEINPLNLMRTIGR